MPRVLFLADQFSDVTRSRNEKHPGGAELTDAAALQACPWPVTTRRFGDLSPGESSTYDIIVVANSHSATRQQLTEVAGTNRHIAFEHDLRVCRWRGNFPKSIDPAHRRSHRCWCPHPESREFFASARVIFLTTLQERIFRNNPYFSCGTSRVLGSSLFEQEKLERAAAAPDRKRSGTVVFASPHRIKGFAEAQRYCRERDIEPSVIRGLPPQGVLELFAQSERFVYLPIGPEWAGRMVVEARLLGCEVVLNDNVGVAGEAFWKGGRAQALAFISDGPARFWRLVEELMNAPRAQATSPTSGPLDSAAALLISGLRHLPAWLLPGDAPRLPPLKHAAW
jgi:hypothetical protein